MIKIQILLSTYNGEAHLREQLESFLSLDNANEVSVLIRDDGSCDSTRLILDEYSKKDNFKVIYGENIGLNRNVPKFPFTRGKRQVKLRAIFSGSSLYPIRYIAL